ncbi:energy transducer TonB [Ideonella margarita]|uniref:Energy transducer TonB n=1 Tax=Ideonella margarita TaxID=2984191 RepID=A0ABU9C6Y9_9BURK
MYKRSISSLLAATLLGGLIVAAPAAHADPKIIKKVPPEFPDEAIRRKVNDGVLKTKVSIDGAGNVTDVQIVEAIPAPAKVFSGAATAALMKWKFEGSGKPDSADIRLVFSQE